MSIGVHSKAPGRTLIKLSKQVLTALFKWLLASQRDPPVFSNSSTGSFLFFTAEHAKLLGHTFEMVKQKCSMVHTWSTVT
jgi:succinylglutamate desuccinylase